MTVATPVSPQATQREAVSEFNLEDRDFDRVRRLIYQRAGISLQSGKQAMVYSRLSRRLRETGHDSFSAYLNALEQTSDENEWQEFINCLTTNLTSFFREDHHFTILADELKARNGSPVRMWCNAASTGEEPYSLAMTIQEAFGARTESRLLATDIDTKVLATARRGVYGADARGLSPERLRQHCLRGTGTNSGSIRMKPELTRLIDFQPFNLMSPRWDFGAPFDIVFCRNVMIYFDAATQMRLMERMHSTIKPGGLLFVGHSEHFSDLGKLFRLRGKTVYVRL